MSQRQDARELTGDELDLVVGGVEQIEIDAGTAK